MRPLPVWVASAGKPNVRLDLTLPSLGRGKAEVAMVPVVFRELDRVVNRRFAFLEAECGCEEPTVEYWRDFFLVYQLAPGVRLRVGMERGCLVPFLFIEYRDSVDVLFELREVLQELAISVDLSPFPVLEQILPGATAKTIALHISRKNELQLEWPGYLEEYSNALRRHFAEVVATTRSYGETRARGGEGGTLELGTVLPGPGASVIGAGSHFVGAEFDPVTRTLFWEIVNRGLTVSYSEASCPACHSSGCFGMKRTGAGKVVGKLKALAVTLIILQGILFIFTGVWRQTGLRLILPLGLLMGFLLLKIVEKAVPMEEYYFPACGHLVRLSGSDAPVGS